MNSIPADDGGLVSQVLQSFIPPPIFNILARFSNIVWRLTAGVSNDPSSWTSTLLPPLVTLIAIYFSLLVAYRTLKSTVLLAIWAVKWGLVLSVVIFIWAWWTGNQDAVNSQGQVPVGKWLSWLSGGPLAAQLLPSLFASFLQRQTESSGPRTRSQTRKTSSSSNAFGIDLESAARAAAKLSGHTWGRQEPAGTQDFLDQLLSSVGMDDLAVNDGREGRTSDEPGTLSSMRSYLDQLLASANPSMRQGIQDVFDEFTTGSSKQSKKSKGTRKTSRASKQGKKGKTREEEELEALRDYLSAGWSKGMEFVSNLSPGEASR